MRRLLLLLLIALLPLQSVHAAAAHGCLPGDAASGDQAAHHEHGGEHDHAAPSPGGDFGGSDAAGATSAGGDPCSGAHGHCCLGMVASGDAVTPQRVAGTCFAADDRALPDVVPDNPLRPPRTTRA